MERAWGTFQRAAPCPLERMLLPGSFSMGVQVWQSPCLDYGVCCLHGGSKGSSHHLYAGSRKGRDHSRPVLSGGTARRIVPGSGNNVPAKVGPPPAYGAASPYRGKANCLVRRGCSEDVVLTAVPLQEFCRNMCRPGEDENTIIPECYQRKRHSCQLCHREQV